MKRFLCNATLYVLLFVLISPFSEANWPTLRGDNQRTGYVDTTLSSHYEAVWIRHFKEERLGTAMEPIVADDKVYITTHNHSLYALNLETGDPVWRFEGNGPFLQSPTFAEKTIVAADALNTIYALDAQSGSIKWSKKLWRGGCSTSPLISNQTVFIGTRNGHFCALDLKNGDVRWEESIGVPIRQTAAEKDGKVYITAEDMRVRCFDAQHGEILWTSDPLMGQTARDYYPVIMSSGENDVVLLRTNPLINMAKRIGIDRNLLCDQAGLDDCGWKNVDKWNKSEEARGNPELWKNEQQFITGFLTKNPSAQTFYVLDSQTGYPITVPPTLWCSGCEGQGTPPVVFPGQRLWVFYRSAYGNWNHGVAPFVSLGFYDISANYISPVLHKHGMRPPWNTFWGTADESQNFVGSKDDVLIIHQGTLSRFNLTDKSLSLIAGNRDTWGGLPNPPWARNEWHGPARGGVAVVDQYIVWLTGSRIICLKSGEADTEAQDISINGENVKTIKAKASHQPDSEQFKEMLIANVKDVINHQWAPLYLVPGLEGQVFFFDDSGDVFEALLDAYPFLPKSLQKQVKQYLAKEWDTHPPYSEQGKYPLDQGRRREYHPIPPSVVEQFERRITTHPFGHIYTIIRYARMLNEEEKIKEAWPDIKTCFNDFLNENWSCSTERPDWRANLYIRSLSAMAELAEWNDDNEIKEKAQALFDKNINVLIRCWTDNEEKFKLPVFENVQEFDKFRGFGKDFIFSRVASHKSKVGLLHQLSPELAKHISAYSSEAVDTFWHSFETLCPTWHLTREERQVHYGENFVDPPDLSLDGFKALAWLSDEPVDVLIDHLDLPYCKGDLTYVTKLALVLAKAGKNE